VRRKFSGLKSVASSERQFLDRLVELFRQDGWEESKESTAAGKKKVDLTISRGDILYVVALKVSSDGRRKNLVAFLAQAILEARAAAQASGTGAVPLAVVAAPLIPRSILEELMSFLAGVAPDAAVGILDLEGLQRFVGPGLEKLTLVPTRSLRARKLRVPDSANLFSDLNQWMLKVLLAPLIPEALLHAPRSEYRNATELAEIARVSIMSAFRFVRQLDQEGFLDKDSETLRLVRKLELMRRWQATYLRSAPELPLCWIDGAQNESRLKAALSAYNGPTSVEQHEDPRTCLAVFAAAESLGFGRVPGTLPSFYLASLDRAVLSSMGLSPDGAEYRPDLLVRVPTFRKSVFRAAVTRDRVPVADIIQVWLDVSSQPERGEAQASEISQRALAQVFNE
jgi:hypothetical protein